MRAKELDLIIKNNKEVLEDIVLYIINTFNVSKEDLIEETKSCVRRCLRHLNQYSYKLKELEERKEQIYNDIKYLEASFVGSEWREPSEEGKNTGGREDKTMLKHIKLNDLKRELENLTIESQSIRASYYDNRDKVKRFIDLLPNETHKCVLKDTYFGLKSASQIAKEYQYAYRTITEYKDRGIEGLVDIMKKYLENI